VEKFIMPKNKDEWTKFIKKLLSRKRSNRPYLIPRDYIEAVADNILSANPTRDILISTVSDVYSTGFTRGYQRKDSDIKHFKEKRERDILFDWNKVKDALDDEIHSKTK
jgi:hypothetical protein